MSVIFFCCLTLSELAQAAVARKFSLGGSNQETHRLPAPCGGSQVPKHLKGWLFVKLPAAACWYLMVRFCCTNISLSSYDTLSGSPCLHMVIFSQGWQSFYVSLWPHNNWLHLKPPDFSGRGTRVTTYLRIENILAHSSLPSHLQNFMVSWHKKYPYPTVSISSNYYLDNINIITNLENLKYCFKI